ncbi:MAG: nucleoside hydrolase [Clostridia bacterium]|nr:nucleoside hydrolase [Clostridia bacterium]
MDEKRKFIIDTDTAGDDAAAIMLAVRSGAADVLGVTVAAGNVSLEQGMKNALAALELVGSDAPVFPGAEKPLNGEDKPVFSVYGKDGMGDCGLISPKGRPQDKNAVDFILETVAKYPGQVEILALAPVTNIALAIQKDPGTMKLVKRIWSMGSAGLGPGNATPVAEFNVYKDAPAYKVMLDLGCPVTVIGLDRDGPDTWISGERLAGLKNGSAAQRFFAASFSGLLEFKRGNGIDAVDIPDGTAAACALWDGYMTETTLCHASCITDPGECYGQVIFYKSGFHYDSEPPRGVENVELVTGAKDAEFAEKLIAALE